MLKYQMIGLLTVSLCVQTGLNGWGSVPYVMEQIHATVRPCIGSLLQRIDEPLRAQVRQRLGNRTLPINLQQECARAVTYNGLVYHSEELPDRCCALIADYEQRIRCSEELQLRRLMIMPGSLIENAVRVGYARALEYLLGLVADMPNGREAVRLITQGLVGVGPDGMDETLLHRAARLGHVNVAELLTESAHRPKPTRHVTDF